MIDKELALLIITIAFGFLTGLEVKNYKEQFKPEDSILIGSTRTYTFLSLIGFLFYKISIWIYIFGFLGFSLLFLTFYYFRLKNQKTSILMYLVGAIVYSYGPISIIYSYWIVALVFVLIVFILNSKYTIQKITQKIDIKEIETFSKFVLLSMVILPLLPKTPIKYLDISAFKIWLAVVIISAISYVSYIFSKFIFKNKGYLLAGIFGGLYSSTATTVVLAKKISSAPKEIVNAGIIIATAMMYLRLIVVTSIFSIEVAKKIIIPYLLLAAVMIGISLIYYKKQKETSTQIKDQNPLELITAFIFAGLFVLMMVLTKFITEHYGISGLKIFAFIAGVSDIDPFILSLLMGKIHINLNEIAAAIFIATGSNNVLKALYAYLFGKKETLSSIIWLLASGIVTILLGFI